MMASGTTGGVRAPSGPGVGGGVGGQGGASGAGAGGGAGALKFTPRISLPAVGLVAILATIVSLLLHVAWWMAFGFGMLGIVLNAFARGGRDSSGEG